MKAYNILFLLLLVLNCINSVHSNELSSLSQNTNAQKSFLRAFELKKKKLCPYRNSYTNCDELIKDPARQCPAKVFAYDKCLATCKCKAQGLLY